MTDRSVNEVSVREMVEWRKYIDPRELFQHEEAGY